MDEKIYEPLLQTVFTRQEVETLLDAISSVLASFYQVTPEEIENILDKNLDSKTSKIVLLCLRNAGVDAKDHEKIKVFLNNLTELLKKAPVCYLTVSVELEKSFIEDICVDLRKTLEIPNLMLEITRNPQILGGAQIIWKGKYIDMTLTKQIEEWFRNKRGGKEEKVSEVSKPL